METRTARLHELMELYRLKAKDVAELLNRSPSTVRIWRCHNDQNSRAIPAGAIELLELKLKARAEAEAAAHAERVAAAKRDAGQ